MSTILKALKRLDEERRAESAPKSLEEQVLAGGARHASQPARNNSLAIVGVAGGLLLTAAGAWLVFGRTAAPEVPLANVPAVAAAAPAASPPPANLALSESLAAPPVPALPDLPRREPSADTFAAAPEAPPADAPARSPAVERAPIAAEQRPELAPPREPPPPRVASAPPAVDPLPEPVREAPQADTSEPEEPLPLAVEANPPPALLVERTQWHPAAEKRSAWVTAGGETRELREGDAIDGAIVREIRPSSVLFLFEGEELKRGVGER